MTSASEREQQEWPSSKLILMMFSKLILCLVVIPKMYLIYQKKKIRRDREFTTATITRFERRTNRNKRYYLAHAQYQVDGQSFVSKGKVRITLTHWQLDSLLYTRLPIVYQKANPANNELLSTGRKFGWYGLALPDSLVWTRPYFIN
jgi:hypothetical protein